jgi:hypothetical protein
MKFVSSHEQQMTAGRPSESILKYHIQTSSHRRRPVPIPPSPGKTTKEKPDGNRISML